MKNNRICILVVLILVSGPMSVNAHEEPAPEDTGPWSGYISAGFLRTAGNTNTSTYNLAAQVKYDRDRGHHPGSAGTSGGKRKNEVTLQTSATSETYRLRYDVKFDVTDRLYAFGDAEWTKNRFSAYDRQVFETVGAGYRFLKTEKHELNGQAGIGATQSDYRAQRPSDPADARWGTSQNEVIYVAGADYTWNFSDTASFVQTLGTKVGSDNTYSFSVSELRASLLSSLALVLSYKIEQNSDVPSGADKRDSYTVISLSYDF